MGSQSFSQSAFPISTLFSSEWNKSVISLDNYAVNATSQARADIVSQLANSSLLTYMGHSAPAAWSRESLITANQVSAGLFNPISNSFAVVQIGCWGAYFVEPTSSTVAHSMLLGEKGAVAIIGASALTDTLTDTALFNALIPRLGLEQFGPALRASLESMPAGMAGANVGAVLLGDPALR